MGFWDSGSMLTQSFEKEDLPVLQQQQQQTEGCRGMGPGMASSWIRGSLIGAGAFGKVNLALNRENGELFAVKSIECNERTSSEMQAMDNEVQILQCLDSPFVVKCLGSSFSVENGKSMHNVFIEYMSGGSVADLMKNFGGHFEEPLIRNYTRNILEGIRYLHAKEIVHCDIKGKNILVGSSGVKLADFGGAKRVGDASAMDSLLNVKGTPLWMAPEVVRQVEQGPASDIWSLGCTVVEMATGKAPWSDIASAANPFVALYHIGCTEEVPDLPSCLSAEGQDFLSKCFQRDPRVRWTADQLLQHPFITSNFHQQYKPATLQQQTASPTSAFDFPCHSDATGYTSSIANSVPILSSPLFAKRDTQQDVVVNFQIEDASFGGAAPDFWCCNSPLSPLPGQWIVVRSPKATSPSSPSAATTSSSSSSCDQEVVSVSGDCEDLPPVVLVAPEKVTECIIPVDHDEEEGKEEDEEILLLAMDDDEEEQEQHHADRSLTEEAEAAPAPAAEEEEEEASCSGCQHHPCRVCSGKGVEDDAHMGTTIQCRSNGRSRRARLSSNARKNSEECMAGDARCVDTRGRPKQPMKFASLRSTLRTLAAAAAHRKVSWRRRRRPKPLLRLTLRKQLHELLYEKVMTLGRSIYSSSFRAPIQRSFSLLAGSIVGTEPQPFFRNRLFLNKTATRPPEWLPYKLSLS